MQPREKKVFVTGMGIISALGNGVEVNFEKLKSGKSGIGKIKLLNTRLKDEHIAGEVDFSDDELIQLSGIKNTTGYSRAALLGLIAAYEACSQTDWSEPGIRTGFINGTTAESMTHIEQYLPDFLNNNSKNEFISSQDWGHSAEIIDRELGISGYTTSINTACSSAANAIMTGARMIKHGLLDRVLVGGTDALSKVMLNGFHALMIVDREICKAFDKNRLGLNVGEGAAYLLLESDQIADPEKSVVELSGWGNANDAHHLTALSQDGSGAAGAMHQALQVAGLLPDQIDYINAHGTGTQNNDLSEAMAIKQVFRNKALHFSSTKAFTSHTLGSSGALEAVISILSLQHQIIFPNLNFSEPMEETALIPVTALKTDAEINNVLSNSLGFGGNNTSLVFSRTGA